MPQTTTPDHSTQALRDVCEAARRYRNAGSPEEQRVTWKALNAAITRAVQVGVKQVKVARTAGLSKAQVSRVIRGGTSGKTSLPPAERLVDTLPAKEVIERYRGGESTRALGAAFGCSRDTISEVLKSHGVPRDKRPGPTPAVLPIEEIVERYERGESIRGIARAYGVSHMTVLRRLRKEESEARAGGVG